LSRAFNAAIQERMLLHHCLGQSAHAETPCADNRTA
jgi:hypothetical protein